MRQPPKPRGKWRELSGKQRSKLKVQRARWRAKNQGRSLAKFANRCRALRKLLKLDQQEFGRHLGVTGQTVSRWERKSGYLPSKEKLEVFKALEAEHATS